MVITSDKVRKATSKLKINKNGGVDEFNSTLIKECGDSLVEPLAELFSNSLSHCEISLGLEKSEYYSNIQKREEG